MPDAMKIKASKEEMSLLKRHVVFRSLFRILYCQKKSCTPLNWIAIQQQYDPAKPLAIDNPNTMLRGI